jgi:hypothetical protein
MRKVPIFVVATVLSTAAALPVSVTARADLVPGGWLQPPRIPQAPPEPEAAPPAAEPAAAAQVPAPPPEPAAAQPVLVAPPAPPPEPAAVQPLPSPKVTRPAVQHRPPPVRTAPPSDGKVQF